MQVILRESVPNVGQAGEIVVVKNGYGRNYLLPRGLAYPATPGNKRRVELEARHRRDLQVAEQADAEAIVTKLAEVELHFTAKAGDGDKLFGSITSADIAGKLAEEGYAVDKRTIELAEPIKMIGIYKVPVRLHPEVRADIRVWVVKE